MSTATAVGVLLIAVPLAFNAAFALLAARFDFPDILRQPTGDVLRSSGRAAHRSFCCGGRLRPPPSCWPRPSCCYPAPLPTPIQRS